jgi:hypothetical protein
MKRQEWFRRDKPNAKRPKLLGSAASPRPTEASKLAARLRPHELIAMLTHHYARARARSLPRVKTSISVRTPGGKQAVTLASQ